MAGGIKGITVKIGGDTSELGKALTNSSKQATALQRELRGVNSLLKMDPKNVTLLKQKSDLLKDSIAETKTKLDSLKQVLAKVESGEIEMTDEEFRNLEREIASTENKLKSLENESKKFGSVFAQQVAQAGESMKEVGGKISDAGEKLLPATGAIAGLGAMAIKTTADFDEAMSNVSAISGATGDELQALRDKAREMGAQTKFSASESADAMSYMAMAGWKTEDMLDGIAGVMTLASASGEDLAKTSDILTDGLTAFGLSASDSGRMANVMASASSNANTNVSMLGESYKYCASTAGAMGFSLEDITESLGLMANAGVKGSQAGTTLRTAMINLAKPTDAMATAMENYGISITNSDGSMKSWNEVVDNLRDSLGGLSEAEQTSAVATIFGKQAVAGMLSVINAGPKDVEKLHNAIEGSNYSIESFGQQLETAGVDLDKMREAFKKAGVSGEDFDKMFQYADGSAEMFIYGLDETCEAGYRADDVLKELGITQETLQTAFDNTGGSAQEMSDTMQDNLNGQLTILQSQLQELAISFGEKLMPIVRDIVSAIQGFVDKLNSLSDGQIKTIAIVAGVIAVLGPLLIVVGKVTTAVGSILTLVPKLVSGFKLIGTAFKALGTAFASNPIGIIITAVVALVAGLVYAYKHCDKFKAVVDKAFAKIKEVITNVMAVVKPAIIDTWNKIKTVVTSVVNAVKTVISTVFKIIKTVITTYVKAYLTVIKTVFNAIKTVVTTVFNAIKKVTTTVFNAIKSAITTAINAVKTSVTKTVNAIKTVFTTAWNAIKTTTSTVFNTIKSAISTAVNAIKSAISTPISAIKSTFKSAWDSIKSTTNSVFSSIKTAITKPISTAKDTVKGIVDKIKGFFNFKVSLPKIKLPHFSISPSGWKIGDLLKGSIPKLGISWYAKGGIFDRPTIIPTMSGLKGVGEAGPEAVAPIDTLMRYVETSVNNSDIIDRLIAVEGVLEKYLPHISDGRQVVLDTGALVGEMIDPIDTALGRRASKLKRGW